MSMRPRHFPRFAAIALAAGLVWCASPPNSLAAGKNSAIDSSLFTSNRVLRLEIEISEAGIVELSQYHWSRQARPEDRVSVPATVREGTNVYTNVAVHLKGSAGSFRPIGDKPGFTLNFEKSAKGQRFHGLEKISLNNSVQDPSFITDKLCREIFNQAGVPTPRAGYATVTLNDRPLGLYGLTEGWNKQFLKRHFTNTKGNLYDCGSSRDITADLFVNSGDHPDDHSDLQPLIAATREPDLTKRLARLEKVLDLNRFITLLALDSLLWNWDGYALNRNNYRLFHDLGSGRFVFLPQGMDQMFWKPDGPILPGMKGMVADAVVQIPECRHRYLDRMAQLMTNVCTVESLTNRVQQLATTIRAAQAESAGWGGTMRRLFQRAPAKELMQRIVERRKSLDEQLSGASKPLTFNRAGTAMLTDWKPWTNSGRVTFKTAKAPRDSLLLSLREPGSSGAWWTTAWLEGGRYRITGRARVQGVKATAGLSRPGAGFRVFSQRKLSIGLNWDWFPFRESNDYERRGEMVASDFNAAKARLTGSTDWVELTYEFDLRQPLADLEISCELMGDAGEATFDLESLKITRL